MRLGWRGAVCRLLLTAISATLAVNWCHPLLAQRPLKQAQLDRGRELFNHVWTANDPLCPAGDGLGPMRNASSCVECHLQGGVGGGGPLAKNVELLTVVRPKDRPPEKEVIAFRETFRERIVAVHPGFRADAKIGTPSVSAVHSTIVFHRFSPNENYEGWKDLFWGVPRTLEGTARAVARKAAHTRESRRGPVKSLPGKDGVAFFTSERNTTALYGAGLIDAIPFEAITTVAAEQRKQFPGIAGRAMGRFGWRGQVHSLEDFVLAACAAELGLEVPGRSQAVNPQRPQPPRGLDLTAEQCHDLVEFVASLPRPREVMPGNAQTEVLVSGGRDLFHSIGCTACHVPNLGGVEGLYSDLLLHDMGSGLADPSPAMPSKVVVGVQTTGGVYGGGSFDVFADLPTNVQQEWRTPPLWGVADSAPYLHDGRAATLDESILLHGGEAQFSVSRYQSMSSLERGRILAFLNTLRAPLPTTPSSAGSR